MGGWSKYDHEHESRKLVTVKKQLDIYKYKCA